LSSKVEEGRSSNSLDSGKLEELEETSVNEHAYMYLSHYSTPGIVFYYLIRKFPSYLTRIQNDDFGGPSDRIFFDVWMSWQNCTKVISDNKELIPEFYLGDGSFLRNVYQADLGENHKN
jgi:factor associated with neutral sphingomyelinase activation